MCAQTGSVAHLELVFPGSKMKSPPLCYIPLLRVRIGLMGTKTEQKVVLTTWSNCSTCDLWMQGRRFQRHWRASKNLSEE